MRIEPHQGKFAARIGISQNKQSFLENATRELRADYLATAAALGVDVHYVLTGERIVTEALDAETTEAVTHLLALPPHLSQVARSMLRTMADEARGAAPAPAERTLHNRQTSYAPDAKASLPPMAALEQAFAALLLASPGMQGDALAHELARRLPILLDVAGRPLKDHGQAGYDAEEESAEDPASDLPESRRA